MALTDKLAQEAPDETAGTEEEEKDLKIAVLMGQRLLDDGGFEVVQSAVKSSKDPGQVIGQFLMQMAQQMFESMPEDMQLSPTVLLAHGGWLEQISDYIQDEIKVKKDVMDKAEIYVASTAQQMAQAKQGMNEDGVQAPAAPQVGPAAPVMPGAA